MVLEILPYNMTEHVSGSTYIERVLRSYYNLNHPMNEESLLPEL